jgi:DNA-binding CsgD family transcriptional regulator
VALVGRDPELRAVSAALTGRRAPLALLLEGEAGIGKTSLWRAGIEAAEGAGQRVVTARPAEAETGLSHAGLSDLLTPLVADGAGAGLPAPQLEALDVALLRSPPKDVPLDPRAVAAATLGVLRAATDERPLVVAIDDVQWLDPASATALRFALRRLDAEPLRLLATERLVPGAGRAELGMQPDRVERLAVEALEARALHAVVQREIGSSVSLPLLVRIAEVSAGNPYYALELARAAVRAGGKGAAGELVLPGGISAVLHDRLAALPGPARDAVGAVAAMGTPTLALASAAFDAGALDPAFAAGVLHEEGDAIRFDHPLLAEAAYRGLPPSRRRAVHELLAGIAEDPEERARHLAAAVTPPDAKIAAAIDAGARAALARGAPAAAAGLLEVAARVEPDPELAAHRRLAATRHHAAAGDGRRAMAISAALVDELPRGPLRSRALVTLAWAQEGSLEKGLDLARRGVEEAGEDVEARIKALIAKASILAIQLRCADAAECLEQALALCGEETDRALRVQAEGDYAMVVHTQGRSDAFELMRKAAAREGDDLIPDAYFGAGMVLGRALVFADELSAARPILEHRYRRAREAGDEDSRCGLCLHLAELECRAGRLGDARRFAEEGLAIQQASYADQAQASLVYVCALVAAHQGDADLARSLAEGGLEHAEAQHDAIFSLQHRTALGFLALSLGDHATAFDHLGPMTEELDRLGVGEPGMFLCHAEAIEALIGLGRLDEAEARLDAWEAMGRRLDRPRIHATAARGRALVAAARGYTDEALQRLEAALEHHEQLPVPLERARTLIVLGTTLRRAKRKAAAREALEEALASLEAMGVRLWADRARAELSRIGGRTRSGGLTPTERRVAHLVAEGRSNKEVADALFVTVRTVEANLTRVYAKLGIRSRTELASRRDALSADRLT